MQAVRLDSGTDYRCLRAGNTAFGRDGGWNMRGMGRKMFTDWLLHRLPPATILKNDREV